MSLLILLAFSVEAVTIAQSGKANFAGQWVLNSEKSQMGEGGGPGFGRMGGGDMKVSQESNLLTIERSRPGRDGGDPIVTVMKYTLDGKESVNSSRMGDSKSTATWLADGKTLKISTSRQMDTMSFTTTEEWSLSGNSLSVKTSMSTPDGERTTVMVYDKK